MNNLKETIKEVLKELNIRPSPGSVTKKLTVQDLIPTIDLAREALANHNIEEAEKYVEQLWQLSQTGKIQ